MRPMATELVGSILVTKYSVCKQTHHRLLSGERTRWVDLRCGDMSPRSRHKLPIEQAADA